ncbi:MAG: arginase family protein [Saprospiraceae bacterium]|nr:arginase family protein [Lewinella sp.]
MYENWLHSVSPDHFKDPTHSEESFGNSIRYFSPEETDINRIRVALVGLDGEAADAVRRYLYPMSFPFGKLEVMDFGNARRQQSSFLVPIIRELMDSRIVPVLIGGTAHMVTAQYRAFKSLKESICQVIVDEIAPFLSTEKAGERYYFHDLLHQKHSRLFHLGLIGCQSHYIDNSTYDFIRRQQFDMIRLGYAKANLPELEPVIREADLLSLHLAAIKQLEAPGQEAASPSGFFSEEACQISRYAGMSDKLSAFGIYGYVPEKDKDGQTAQVIAQMIWYFLDGFYNRKNDFPVSTDGLIEYIVDFKDHDYQLTFWKSSKSGRWWMQIPVKTNKKLQRHRLIPCSYNDYKMASQDELPERLLRALQRFD